VQNDMGYQSLERGHLYFAEKGTFLLCLDSIRLFGREDYLT
jgi:hypothetical protein